MQRRITKVLAGLIATGGLVLSMASPATAAAESNYASLSSDPGGGHCAIIFSGPGTVEGCFVPYGDYLYINHADGDDITPYIDWNNWLRKPDGNYYLYRSGFCFSNLGPGTWGRCNKDFYEHGSKNHWDGYGSKISFRVCVSSSYCDDWHEFANNR